MTTVEMVTSRYGNRVLLGREYLRVSVDRWGLSTSTDEQRAEDLLDAAREGNVLSDDPYVDKGRSASRYATKVREGFDRLIRDLEVGEFGADFLQMWEPSRGSRRMDEWVRLLNLLEDGGILVRITSHGRMYDPRNPRDRRTLLEDAVDSEFESGKTSKRVARNVASAAERGRPHGTAPFGYRRRYDEHTGKLVTQEPHPVQAPIVRELYARLRRGHSLRSIELDFERRGIRNGVGTRFSHSQLRDIALNPAYAAKRVHAAGKGLQAHKGYRDPDAKITAGDWERLVPESMYLGVVRKLYSNRGAGVPKPRPGRAVHWLTVMARCAACGGPLSTNRKRKRKANGEHEYEPTYYICGQKGCVRVGEDALDVVAQEMLFRYLEQDGVYSQLSQADEESCAELARLEDEIEQKNQDIRNMAADVRAGRVTMDFVALVEPGMREDIRVAEKRRKELATPAAIRDFIAPGEDIRSQWEGFPMSARRELARLVFTPERMGRITVMPRPQNRQGSRAVPVAERIALVLADG